MAVKKVYVCPYSHSDWAWICQRRWHEKRYIRAFEIALKPVRVANPEVALAQREKTLAVSGIVAIIFMEEIETRALATFARCPLFLRYVDDCYALVRSAEEARELWTRPPPRPLRL